MDAALIVLTAGLTLATIALAYFTWTLASEAKKQRLLGLRPHFTLGVEMLDPIIGVVTVTNVGAGSAFDTALTITFESDEGTDSREWSAATLLPRATRQFRLPPPRPGAPAEAMSEAAIQKTRVRLTGKTHDLDGCEHAVEDDLDIAAWWGPVIASKERFQRDALNSIADSLRKIAPK